MPFLPVGRQADLTSYRTGSFIVSRFAGRGKGGLPLWELACEACHQSFPIVEHRKLAAAIESGAGLPCTNAQCPSKRSKTESFQQFNVRMRREKEEVASAAGEAAAKAAAEAAQKRARDAQSAALKASYREFFMHQDSAYVKAGLTPNIMAFSRWSQLDERDRNRLLEAIRAQPDIRVELS